MFFDCDVSPLFGSSFFQLWLKMWFIDRVYCMELFLFTESSFFIQMDSAFSYRSLILCFFTDVLMHNFMFFHSCPDAPFDVSVGF